ncbi:unnamed protein product [Schistosoma curassoni]|uniref:Lipoprotein n=1 Tax=Schistosoma curassoni TaxID=6186 RepID=A0A183K2C8_9TREM|nr:unnamed protein product [Schistosoma curassoni]
MACNNPIAIDREDLEDVKTSTYLVSNINEHGGSDADVKAWISNWRTTEEHMELKTIVNQHQGQNFRYK